MLSHHFHKVFHVVAVRLLFEGRPVKPFNLFPPGSDYRLSLCRKFMVGAGENRRYRFVNVRLCGCHKQTRPGKGQDIALAFRQRGKVSLSALFKEQFWKMLCDGKAPRDIVIALGIDPDILGDNRIAGLKAIVKREVKAGKGFRDYITYTGGSSNYMSPEARIKYLEQQVEYKDQEIAFLKK